MSKNRVEFANGTLCTGLEKGEMKVDNVNRMGRGRAIWER